MMRKKNTGSRSGQMNIAEFESFFSPKGAKTGTMVTKVRRTPHDDHANDDEACLAALVEELHLAVTSAKQSLNAGIKAVNEAFLEARISRGPQ